MSEWSYIGTAYGLTWVTFAVYLLLLNRRRLRALEAARIEAGGAGGER